MKIRGTAPNGTRRAFPCLDYVNSGCQKGNDCSDYHIPHCNKWMQSTCPRGTKCVYLHCNEMKMVMTMINMMAGHLFE